jgi:hypothetical protein
LEAVRDIKGNGLDYEIVDHRAVPDPIPVDTPSWGMDTADCALNLVDRPAAALRYRIHSVPSSKVPDKIHRIPRKWTSDTVPQIQGTTTVDTGRSGSKN